MTGAELQPSDNYMETRPGNVMTGDADRSRYLYYQLKYSMLQAQGIDLIVSFLMESGVELLLPDLKRALDRGAQIRILTGNYLGITQPSALYLLRQQLGQGIDLRFYNDKTRSFHPKSYIFHYPDHSEIYIGSSNVSRSALTSGIEWNYRFSSTRNPEDYETFFRTFEDLFRNHSIIIDNEQLRNYSKNWHRPAVYKDLARYDEKKEMLPESSAHADAPVRFYKPRGAQIEALYALQECRSEGVTRALVQAATGIGKTYLAAFDSQNYRRVLFVAHRQEILDQAALSFRNVRENADIGFFIGSRKETDHDLIFASVESLGKEEYLQQKYFAPDAFDYLIIDEFHHAITDQYRRIIAYFKPKFLLGLTATPERMDGRDIYELCDYQVPFELSLRDAINKGMLVPFHYYGVYDDTQDYSAMHFVNGHYDEQDLNRAYIGNRARYDLIYKYYMKYRSERALGFCCSRSHAEDMAREFTARGVAAAAVYSGEQSPFALGREEALRRLKTGRLHVIFSVDMFNEGVDIANLDMVMFLRPTQSPVVFLQQLGRGLRRAKGKEYLNVLDFIGNYRRAGQAPALLAGDGRPHADAIGDDRNPGAYPDDCIVDFDMRLIDLFRQMHQRSVTISDRIREEMLRIRDQLNHVPSRMELFTGMDADVYTLCLQHAKLNPFRRYLECLHGLGWLTAEEEKIYHSIGREFLDLVSTTNMSKVYKMPVLLSFIDSPDSHLRMAVTDEQVLRAWKEFFQTGTNWRDFDAHMTFEKYGLISDREHLKKIHEMPVHFLMASGKGFFVHKEGCAIALNENLRAMAGNPAFVRHYTDIVEYRVMDYYRRRYVERTEK